MRKLRRDNLDSEKKNLRRMFSYNCNVLIFLEWPSLLSISGIWLCSAHLSGLFKGIGQSETQSSGWETWGCQLHYQVVNLFTDFLTDRKQYVTLNSQKCFLSTYEWFREQWVDHDFSITTSTISSQMRKPRGILVPLMTRPLLLLDTLTLEKKAIKACVQSLNGAKYTKWVSTQANVKNFLCILGKDTLSAWRRFHGVTRWNCWESILTQTSASKPTLRKYHWIADN